MQHQDLRPEQQRRTGRPEAAAICFNWQPEQVVTTEPELSEAMEARKRGFKQSLITATLAAALYYFLSHGIGTMVFYVACFLLASSLLTPLSIYAGVERLVAWIAGRLEVGVTWFLMRAIFHLIFAPFRMLFRTGLKDPLKRFMEPDALSYWNLRSSEVVTAESRKRLY